MPCDYLSSSLWLRDPGRLTKGGSGYTPCATGPGQPGAQEAGDGIALVQVHLSELGPPCRLSQVALWAEALPASVWEPSRLIHGFFRSPRVSPARSKMAPPKARRLSITWVRLPQVYRGPTGQSVGWMLEHKELQRRIDAFDRPDALF